MSEFFASKITCIRCGVCSYICPKRSISIIKDDAGFLYPEVDTNSCIECGLCKDVCHLNKIEKTIDKKRISVGIKIHKFAHLHLPEELLLLYHKLCSNAVE